jgi:hypothetical protein
MFGKHDDDQDSAPQTASGFDPNLASEFARMSALSLPQLAAEVMAKGFDANEDPHSGGSSASGIADAISPQPEFRLRDSTVKAQLAAQREAADPTSDRYKWLQLKHIVAEGLQALEHASLIVAVSHFDGVATSNGFVTTRAGRTAITQASVAQVVGGAGG